MAYNYKDNIIENISNSYQDKFLQINENWEDDDIEKKRVKLISWNEIEDKNITFEDKINNFIECNKRQIKIYDIKFNNDNVLIIYEKKSNLI